MNDQFGGQNLQTNPIPPAPPAPTPLAPVSSIPAAGGWAPAAEPAPTATPIPVLPPVLPPVSTPVPPLSSNPFEATPPLPPVSGPMEPMGDQGMMEPAAPKSSLPLIIILVILIILGGLFFASWMGWISLFGLEKLWNGSKTESPAVETTVEPVVSANINDAKRKDDLANLKTALKAYYTATQGYPVAATTEKTLDSAALKVLVPGYITALPDDPASPTNYYGYKSDGKTFELTAVLEDATDPSGMVVGNILLYKVTDISAETPTSSNSSSGSTTTTPTETIPADTSTLDLSTGSETSAGAASSTTQ